VGEPSPWAKTTDDLWAWVVGCVKTTRLPAMETMWPDESQKVRLPAWRAVAPKMRAGTSGSIMRRSNKLDDSALLCSDVTAALTAALSDDVTGAVDRP
jgi:hypothetical protein